MKLENEHFVEYFYIKQNSLNKNMLSYKHNVQHYMALGSENGKSTPIFIEPQISRSRVNISW